MNIKELEAKISNFIQEEFLYDRMDIKITNELNIIEQGILDSMDIFRLIQFIEEQVGITFMPEEMTQTNFQSINKIINFVKDKQSH